MRDLRLKAKDFLPQPSSEATAERSSNLNLQKSLCLCGELDEHVGFWGPLVLEPPINDIRSVPKSGLGFFSLHLHALPRLPSGFH